ncbi:metal ABC transporter solute-binding protein, Zn/Mn family [Clostridium sp. BSD9I1]|uniref:metal ABC transporter substrate-binding protein n=1 Tax=Clostridium sp. BSD9I1 TaxID=2003589 RepID=UPI001648A2FB|nr:zinc ABC transporter substrate-binding protein [Clostridium sp. BSD9I1]
MKKLFYVVILYMAAVLYSCTPVESTINNEWKKPIEKEEQVLLNIVTTNKFIYNMTLELTKDRHYVSYMFKDPSQGMNFKYTDDSLSNISKQDLFIYNGVGLEPWDKDFIDSLSKNKLGVTSASRGVKLIAYNKEKKYGKRTIKDNPYYWLNIDNYKISILNIKNALQDKDPRNNDYYEKNFMEHLKKIEPYEKDFKKISKELEGNVIFFREEELEYFVKYVGLKSINSLTIKNDKDLEEKLNAEENILFMYNNNEELKKNEEIIKKYNMHPVKIHVYEENFTYIDLLKNNLSNLKKIKVKKE